ncbi:MAG: hypothetical protein WCC92_07525 [Candidatus Korobacteraceae bacterium]
MSGELRGFIFGGCKFNRTGPAIAKPSPETKKLNIEVGFEDALKLHLAVGECISKLNQFNRATTVGKRAALNLVVHLDSNRITVNETRAKKN